MQSLRINRSQHHKKRDSQTLSAFPQRTTPPPRKQSCHENWTWIWSSSSRSNYLYKGNKLLYKQPVYNNVWRQTAKSNLCMTLQTNWSYSFCKCILMKKWYREKTLLIKRDRRNWSIHHNVWIASKFKQAVKNTKKSICGFNETIRLLNTDWRYLMMLRNYIIF